jgi:hypothetical protein
MPQQAHNDVALFYPMDYDIVPDTRQEEILAATLHWSVDRGVVRPASPAQQSLARMRSDLATVLAYPVARGDAAQFISDFIGWYLLLDDDLESRRVSDDDAFAAMPPLFERYLAALAQGRAPRRTKTSEASSGLLRGAADLGARLCLLGGRAWRARFLRSMWGYFLHGVLREMSHHRRGTLPSLAEYVDLRVESSGSYPIFDLIEVASGSELPDDVAAHPLIQDLRRTAAVTISWANDVLSFHKEKRRSHQGALNLPLLLMSDSGLSEGQAFTAAVGIHNAEMRHYLSLREEVLETSALDQAVVRPWLRDLDVIMRGLLEWQLLAARYTDGRDVTVLVRRHAGGAGAAGPRPGRQAPSWPQVKGLARVARRNGHRTR